MNAATPQRNAAVVVIGDVMLDIIAAPRRPIELGTDTPSEITLLPGGSGANVAAWLAHFGNDAIFVGRVGQDGAPEHAAALRAHGVDPILAVDTDVRTGVLVTLVGPNAERSFLTDRGANARLSPCDLPVSVLGRATHVHVSGYAFFESGPRAAVCDFLAVAAGRNIPFSVDCGSAAFLREVGPSAFLGWTRRAAVCFANADEAAVLTGSTTGDDGLAQLATHYATIVVTAGASGARAGGADGTLEACPAAQVNACDSTGAGDSFVAGFLTQYLRGGALRLCLQAGTDAGAASVLRYGGRPKRLDIPTHGVPNSR